jgi:hypothetical protein
LGALNEWLITSERSARPFEAKYRGIAVQVERSGGERTSSRIAQEQGSGIGAAHRAGAGQWHRRDDGGGFFYEAPLHLT